MADSTIMKTLNGYEICDAVSRGMSPVMATSEDGASYTATVNGITALTTGINFVMVPSVDNTVAAPTLNVNGLGEKQIRLQLSTSSRTTTPGGVDENEIPNVWLVHDAPIKVTYDNGAAGVGAWVADITMPDTNTAYGILPVANGGTGCDNLADLKTALDITGADGVVAIDHGGTGATTAIMARTNLGAAAESHTHDASDIASGVLSIEMGGTGASTLAEVRNNLCLGSISEDGTGALSISNGGTGATTGADALNKLGITWGEEVAPETGEPNTIYIQIN